MCVSQRTPLHKVPNTSTIHMTPVVQQVDNLTLFCCYYIVAGQFGQSLLQLDSSQSTLKSQMQDQAKLLNEVNIVNY